MPILRDEGNVFARLIDAAPDAMVVVDGDGKIVYVNIQTEKAFGYTRDELMNQPIEVLIPERYRSTHVGQRQGFTQAPKVRPMGSGLELFGRRKDGSELAVEISLSPIETEQGRLVCAAIRNVTERKALEAAARRTNQFLINAVESVQGAFALFDEYDRMVMCNSSYRALFGRALKGEIVNLDHQSLVDATVLAGMFELGEESEADFRARWQRYHQNPTGFLELELADGRVLRLVDRRTSDGGRVNTTWDITEDVRREDELRVARSQAEAASSAKSEFLASMSHELRTPLNAVLGFAQLLQRDKKQPLSPRQLERLDHVVKGGEHLLRLIDDVLDLSRIEAGRTPISLEPVHVREVLEQVKATLDPMAMRAEITLAIDPLPAELPDVVADRIRFSQILMNYGTNAIKYGRPGGSARFRVTVADGRVRVTMRDDGMGIPLDKQERIFQPFHRAGQEAGPIEGTGIGLTISKRLAEIMGGSVGFASTPGQGSEFWIELPIDAGTTAALATASGSRSEPSRLAGSEGARHIILYVEDNPSNIAFMEDFLADFDRITLLTAPNAEIGIELARARHPRLIIMDINLPGISGFEAVHKLRSLEETKDIPVVGLSAAAMVRDAERAEEAGFYCYLTKPVRVDELSKVLDEVLVGGAHKRSV